MTDILTYAQIANSWELWQEYVDPGANMAEEEFDAMTHDAKVDAMTEMFGVELYHARCSRCGSETTVSPSDLHAEEWEIRYALSFEGDWSRLRCPTGGTYDADWEEVQ